MTQPEVIVCAGGGGVGKTTTSAALALSLARSGRRALIVSIDPARRLADALGVELGTEASELAIDAGQGHLFGLMPDPKRGMRTFVEILFEDQPEALNRLFDNRLYQALEDSVPGIHELATVNLTCRAIAEHSIDVVVIDTAPSRNAVDFVDYPRRLAKLLGGRAIGWLSSLAQRRDTSSQTKRMGTAERLLTGVLGPVVRDIAGLFAELARVRRRFVSLNEQTAQLLLGGRTRYVLVAGPTGAAEDDTGYLVRKLAKLNLHPSRLLINSAFVSSRPWADVLRASNQMPPAILEVLQTLSDENSARESGAARVKATFAREHPTLSQTELPFIESIEPKKVVYALAECLDASLFSAQSNT